jgi:hypothetical protein
MGNVFDLSDRQFRTERKEASIMVENAVGLVELSQKSTEELKQELLDLTCDRDADPMSQKVQFYKDQLAPWFEELSRRNPFPDAADQVRLVPGVWMPVWSTIPFQDIFPGRVYDQSYQIFQADGYYANMARYAPGSKLPIFQKLAAKLLTYDFMILQKFEVVEGQWYIQNVAIKQAFRINVSPLTIDKATTWFNQAVRSQLQKSAEAIEQKPNFEKLDKSTARKYEKIFQAKPQLQHLYIDPDFRLVKTQREAKQRPSYTIAVRLPNHPEA